MRGKTIFLLLALASSPGVGAGEIYRCTAANGDVMYTNIACPSDSHVQHVASYEAAPAVRSAQVEAEAAQAAAISARLAQQAAADARAAAYQASQAAYHGQDEGESVNYNSGDNLLWYPTYPYFGAGSSGLGSRRHRHDGGHGDDGGHGGRGPGAPQPMPHSVSPTSVNLLVRH